MVVEGDGTATAICPADREILAKVAIVLGPELILSAVAVVVAIERMACVIRGVVFRESFVDVELHTRVTGEAVESEVGVALGVVGCSVVDHADEQLALHIRTKGAFDQQVLVSSVALANDKVSTSS